MFENPLKTVFFIKKYTYYNLCLDCNIYFLFEKQALNGLLKVIGLQTFFVCLFIMRKQLPNLFKEYFMHRCLKINLKWLIDLKNIFQHTIKLIIFPMLRQQYSTFLYFSLYSYRSSNNYTDINRRCPFSLLKAITKSKSKLIAIALLCQNERELLKQLEKR